MNHRTNTPDECLDRGIAGSEGSGGRGGCGTESQEVRSLTTQRTATRGKDAFSDASSQLQFAVFQNSYIV